MSAFDRHFPHLPLLSCFRMVGDSPDREKRLESWKEIADYLGVSDRTARRYEAEAQLPVHRLVIDKRGTVYALPSEIDEWRRSRSIPPPTSAATPAPAPLDPIAKGHLLWIVAALVVFGGIAVAFAWLFRRPGPAAFLRPAPFANSADLEVTPAISPDGAWVAFGRSSTAQHGGALIRQRTASGEQQTIVQDSEFALYSPAWSPNGDRIAYLRLLETGDKELWITTLDGRKARQSPLVHAPPIRDFRGAQLAWVSERELIFAMREPGAKSGLFLWNLETGQSKRLTTTTAYRDATPAFHAPTRRLAFLREYSWAVAALCILPLENVEQLACNPDAGNPRAIQWSADGQSLLVSDGAVDEASLFRYSPTTKEKAPIPLADPNIADFSSREQQLVYSRLRYRQNIVRYPVKGDSILPSSGVPFHPSSRTDRIPLPSPDGKRIVFSSNRSGAFDLYLAEVDQAPIRLTHMEGGGESRAIAWSPDGKLIFAAFTNIPHTKYYLIDTTGGPPRSITLPEDDLTSVRFTPDGKAVECQFLRSRQVYEVPIASDRPVRKTDKPPTPNPPNCTNPAGSWRFRITETDVHLGFLPAGSRELILSPKIPFLTGIALGCTPDGKFLYLTVNASLEADLLAVNGLR